MIIKFKHVKFISFNIGYNLSLNLNQLGTPYKFKKIIEY